MSIETVIKIFDPRTVELDGGRGRSRIKWDEIAAILAHLERDNPVGYSLIMLKFRGEKGAEVLLRNNITAWAMSFCARKHISDSRQQHVIRCLAQTALDLLIHKPLSTQIRSLQHLHRLYGGYARRESTRLKKLRKTLQAEQKKPESRQWAGRICFLEEQIETSRAHIERWVEAHAVISTQCPRCRGAGVVTLPRPASCPVCHAAGWVAPDGTGDYQTCRSNGKTG